MSKLILEIENIKVRYSGLSVLQGISLKINYGETACVLGSNGAGKSTLIRAIMGIQPLIIELAWYLESQLRAIQASCLQGCEPSLEGLAGHSFFNQCQAILPNADG